jgi:hypothetical protein
MKYVSLIILMFLALNLNAQSRWSIGAFGGLGHSYHMKFTDYLYTQDARKVDYNYGLGLSVRLKDSTRLRLEGAIQRTALKRDWPQDTSTNKDAYHFVTSINNMYYLDIDLRVDILLCKLKRFDFYLSPGVKTKFSLGDYESTYFENGDNTLSKTKTTNYLNYSYKKTLIAPSLELLVKYNLGKHVGITLAPEYSYYFREFYYVNDGDFNQLNVKLGMEFTF